MPELSPALLWLKFTPPLIAFLVALLSLRSDKRKKGRVQRVGLPLLYFITAMATCWIIYAEDGAVRSSRKEAAAWQAKALQKQQEANLQMIRIEGRLGNDEMMQRYIEATRHLSQRFAAQTTETAIDKFFSSQNERKRLQAEIDSVNGAAVNTYRIRFEPVCEFALAKLDTWLAGIRKRGMLVRVETKTMPAVVIGNRGTGDTNARTITFENGDRLLFQIYAATIEGGRISEPLHIQMPFFLSKGGGSEVFVMDGSHKRFSLANPRPAKFGYKSYMTESDNPVSDAQLLENISAAIDEVMAAIIHDVTNSSGK